MELRHLTMWLWYHTHPGAERNRMPCLDYEDDHDEHPSDVCRSLAVKVMEFLDTLPEARPVNGHGEESGN